jgi:hypothetical protein
MTGVLIRREKFGCRDTDMEERLPCKDGGRHWSYAQKSAKDSENHQKLEETRILP